MWLAALLEHGNAMKERVGKGKKKKNILVPYFQEVLLVFAVRWVHLAVLNEETICYHGICNQTAFARKQQWEEEEKDGKAVPNVKKNKCWALLTLQLLIYAGGFSHFQPQKDSRG